MSISKKLRFEVFKRDSFSCQYCGKTPPEITLEADHINPKSKGGPDDINNLITACFDCNRGKSNIKLSKIPDSLKNNLERMQEKDTQLEEYNKFLKKISRRLNKSCKEVNDIYNSYFKEYELTERFKEVSLKRFFNHLPLEIVKKAMNKACSITGDSDDSIKYFCGICWNLIKNPEDLENFS